MIVGSGEEGSPGWALRAAGPEQGSVFTEGGHESHAQDRRGLEEFSLLGSAPLLGAGVHLEFLLPTPSGAPQHISLPRSQESLRSTKSSPRRSTRSSGSPGLAVVGKAVGSLRFFP